MKWKSVLKTVASTALAAHPAGAGILATVNAFLPDDKKLNANSTGTDALSAIESLPAEAKVSIYNKLADVEIAEINGFSANVKALAEVDLAGQSTRPAIAMMMAWTITIQINLICVAVAWGIFEDKITLDVGWPAILVLLGTPIALLRTYFGLRSDEKKARYAASNGAIDLPKIGFLKGLLK